MSRALAAIARHPGWPLLLALLLLALEWPAISQPVWGDGQAYVVPNGLLMLEDPGRVFIDDEVHPPFFFRMLAEAYRIFGTGPEVPHGLVLLFAFLALLYTWRLGETFFGSGSGAAASLLLLFSPLFFCQAGLVRLAVPLTALSVMTLYYGLASKPLRLALCGAALVLTKHPGVFISAALVAGLLTNFRPGRQRRPALIFAAALPGLVFIAWALLCRWHYGWMFHPENTADLGLAAGPLLARTGYWLRQLAWLKGMWVPALFIAAGAIVLLSGAAPSASLRQAAVGRSGMALALGLPFIFFVGFFSCYAFDFPRYLLPLYPTVFLLAAAGARSLRRQRPTAGLLLLLALGIPLFTVGWFRDYTVPRPREYYESDLAYREVIAAKAAAAAWLEIHHRGQTVLTGKTALDLREPAFGYVSEPFDVLHLPRKRGLDIDHFRRADVFYLFSATSVDVEGRNRRRLLRSGIRPVLAADFSTPCIPLKIYRLESTAPADAGAGR